MSASTQVLVVDDERFFREAIRDVLAGGGQNALQLDTVENVANRLPEEPLVVYYQDLRRRAHAIPLPVTICTATDLHLPRDCPGANERSARRW